MWLCSPLSPGLHTPFHQPLRMPAANNPVRIENGLKTLYFSAVIKHLGFLDRVAREFHPSIIIPTQSGAFTGASAPPSLPRNMPVTDFST